MNDPWGNRGRIEQDALRCVVHITSKIVVEGSDAVDIMKALLSREQVVKVNLTVN
jgi:hypothetical protein